MIEVFSRRPKEARHIDHNRQMVSGVESAGYATGQAVGGAAEVAGAGSQMVQGGIESVYMPSVGVAAHNFVDIAAHGIHHLLAKGKLNQNQETLMTRGLYWGLGVSLAAGAGDAVATLTKNSAKALDKASGVTGGLITGKPLHEVYEFMSSFPIYSLHAFDEKNANWLHQAASLTNLGITALSAALVTRAVNRKYGSVDNLRHAKGGFATKDQDRYDHMNSDVLTTGLSAVAMIGSEHAPAVAQEPIRTVASLFIAKLALKYIARFAPTDKNIKRGDEAHKKQEETVNLALQENSEKKVPCACGHDSKPEANPKRRKLGRALTIAAIAGGTILGGLAGSTAKVPPDASHTAIATKHTTPQKLAERLNHAIIQNGDTMFGIVRKEAEEKGLRLSLAGTSEIVARAAQMNREAFPDENFILPGYVLKLPSTSVFESKAVL